MGHAAFSNGPEDVLRGIARWEIRDRAQTARRSIVTTAHACSREASTASTPSTAGGGPAEPCASSDAVLQLQRFVGEYAHTLAALGHDALGAAEQAAQAVHDGYSGETPDPALLTAVHQWCADALSTARPG